MSAPGKGKPQGARAAQRQPLNPVVSGLVLIVIALLVAYFGFTKAIPFESHYEIKGVFTESFSIRSGANVRIAGVNVGEVADSRRLPGSNLSEVTLRIDDESQMIHKDATMKIRPQLFIEGNYFVDLRPGTPSAPKLSDGGTVPVTQTAVPVQLSQVLTALQQPTRAQLQELLVGFGSALSDKPTQADDATQDESVQGKTGAQALNASLNYSADALRGTAITNEALTGLDSDDLPRLVSGLDQTFGTLDESEVQLTQLVTNLNQTLSVLADNSDDLRASVRELGPFAKNANLALKHLDEGLPETRAFAQEILPGIKASPAAMQASLPWFKQMTKLMGQSELGGLTPLVAKATPDLAQFSAQAPNLLRQLNLLSLCFSKVILPTGNQSINDRFATGVESYKELGYNLVGLASMGGLTDGNGMFQRQSIGGGDVLIESQKIPNQPDITSRQIGNAVVAPLGTQPTYPGRLPPIKSTDACYKQQLPNLNGPASKVGPGFNVIGTSAP